MTQYIIRRTLISIPLLFFLSIASFIIINSTPGDPITAMIDPMDLLHMPPGDIERRREELGLNKPMVVRYFLWAKEVVQGNLGYSLQTRQPVFDMYKNRLPATMALMFAALGLGIASGILAGIISALRQYSRLDYSLTISAFFMVSIPEFFFALSGLLIFAVVLGWLPTAGMWTPGGDIGFNWDLIHHSILPILALSLRDIAGYMRYTRASVLDALSSDFVTTARAKGLPERIVLFRHVVRNALIPIVTILGLSLPALVGGALIIETIFSWPGVGLLGYTALLQRDYPVQLGLLLIGATLVLIANLITDLAYAWVDPRIRHS